MHATMAAAASYFKRRITTITCLVITTGFNQTRQGSIDGFRYSFLVNCYSSLVIGPEGLQVVNPAFESIVLPLAAAILIALFAVQRRGTHAMGKVFGPVIHVWCVVLVLLGVRGVAMDPTVLFAFSPHHAVLIIVNEPVKAFLALGAVVLVVLVVLVVSGAEAIYTDMGQFGKKPIRIAWLCVVMPSLLINYAGQAALVTADPNAIESPFLLLAPEWARLPLVVLAACATVIASQAVISGAFSIASQAIKLDFLPRLRIVQTSCAGYCGLHDTHFERRADSTAAQSQA